MSFCNYSFNPIILRNLYFFCAYCVFTLCHHSLFYRVINRAGYLQSPQNPKCLTCISAAYDANNTLYLTLAFGKHLKFFHYVLHLSDKPTKAHFWVCSVKYCYCNNTHLNIFINPHSLFCLVSIKHSLMFGYRTYNFHYVFTVCNRKWYEILRYKIGVTKSVRCFKSKKNNSKLNSPCFQFHMLKSPGCLTNSSTLIINWLPHLYTLALLHSCIVTRNY